MGLQRDEKYFTGHRKGKKETGTRLFVWFGLFLGSLCGDWALALSPDRGSKNLCPSIPGFLNEQMTLCVLFHHLCCVQHAFLTHTAEVGFCVFHSEAGGSSRRIQQRNHSTGHLVPKCQPLLASCFKACAARGQHPLQSSSLYELHTLPFPQTAGYHWEGDKDSISDKGASTLSPFLILQLVVTLL